MSFQAKDHDLTGKTVGEYQVMQRLGIGGMGVVYEGLQPVIGKRVAVKVLLPSLSSDEEIVERFLSEARAVNAIRHRGIVDIFSFGQLENGSHYFVMEYLDGAPFDRLLKERGPQSAYDVLTWTEEILDALDAAHSAGVIHRDIKPSNLFLVSSGRGRSYVKLLDFGIAKLGALRGESTPQTRASAVIGTPDYMSPEQARGRPISPATDIYALGCVLYELLTGERVFHGENPMQTMFMHVENEPPRASTLNPKIPKQLDDLLLWMMEKDPANRPTSAAELKPHIEELLRQIPSERTQAFVPPSSRSYPNVATPTSGAGSRRQPRSATPAPTRAEGTPAKKQAPVSDTRASISMVSPLEVTLPPKSDRTRIAVRPDPVPMVVAAPIQLEREATVDVEPEDNVPLPTPTKSGGQLAVVAVLVGVVVLGGGGLWFKLRSPAEGPTTTTVMVPVPPPEKPEVIEVVKPEAPDEKPPVVEEQPKPPVVVVAQPKVPPVVVKKTPRTFSAEEVSARLAKLEQKLAAKESKSGSKDRVLHQFIEEARTSAAKAKTAEDRAEVWQFLNEVQKQMDGS